MSKKTKQELEKDEVSEVPEKGHNKGKNTDTLNETATERLYKAFGLDKDGKPL